MSKIIECEMLDSFGIWGKVKLQSKEFKFKDYYCNKKGKGNIQIWIGKNKELFILKDIKEVEEEC